MVWDGFVAFYLFLAGLGAGAFVLGVLAGWAKNPAPRMKKIAFVVALVTVAVGTLVLVFDAKAGLGNPMRFFLLVTNLSSVMAWGVIILSAFLVVAFVDLVILMVKKADAEGARCRRPGAVRLRGRLHRRAAGRRGRGVPAVEHGRPADPLRGVGGFDRFRSRAPGHPPRGAGRGGRPSVVGESGLGPACSRACFGGCPAGGDGVGGEGSAAEAAAASVGALVSGAYAVPFWLGFVGIGLVLPFCLELLGRRKAGAGEADRVPARRWP